MQRKMRNLIDLSSLTDAQAASINSGRLRGRIVNQDEASIDLLFYGVIGDSDEGLDAKSVVEYLADNADKKVRARISSPGGLAFEGIVIHNAFVKHDSEVTTEIEGIAGSSAGIIAVGGDKVRIHANASLFMHRASGLAWGNTIDMIDMAEFLEVLDGQIARTFAAKTGLTVEKIMEMLTGKRDGTTLGAEQAVELRFCDEIIPVRGDGKAEGASETAIATDNAGSTTSTTDGGTDHTPVDQFVARVAAEEEREREAITDRLKAKQRLWELETGGPEN